MMPFIRDLFQEANRRWCIVRVSMGGGVASVIAAGLVELATRGTFHYVEFAAAIATIMAGGSGAVKLKRRTPSAAPLSEVAG